MIWAVIMVGGTGTRLWPASRAARPKQTMKIAKDESLLAGTYSRAKALAGERVLVVATARLGELIRRELPTLPDGALVVEPEGRDTAACVCLAALHVSRRDPSGVMIVMPTDHIVEPVERFLAVARTAAAVAERERCLVTVGVPPRCPSTAYGYVRRGEPIAGEYERPVFRVAEFREKPDEPTAKEYIASGEYLWNSGVFAWRADVILEELARYLPRHHRRLVEASASFGGPCECDSLARAYAGIPRVSIDYGVLERAEKVAVVEADFHWDDVGSWTALAAHLPHDAHGNAVRGELVGIDVADCVVVAPEGKLVAAVGVQGYVIVDTPDVILVCPRSRDQDVKKIVEKLRDSGRSEFL